MKKIIVIIFLFVAVTVSAQDIPDDDTTSKPAITAIGKPDGAKAEMKIGKDGGSLTSADRKVKLIIPEGAISKKTTFSIQPVTNLMPNGNGKAYRLEPSGIEFQKPVELVFHYDPKEAEDSAQLLIGIAMQDDKGQWYGLNEFTLDTVTKTISGNINHFSIWATFFQLKLATLPRGAPKKRVKVKKVIFLEILGVTYSSKPEAESLDPLSPLSTWKPPHTVRWRVDKIIKGNPVVGTLQKGVVEESNGKFNSYTAPANIPDKNPVTISVDLVGAFFTINRKTIKNLELKTKVLIYDNAYEVKMTSISEEKAGSVLGTSTYLDTGSFVVSLASGKAKIIETINKNTSDIMDYKGKCEIFQLVPGSGYIHIIGVKSIKVIPPALPKDNSWIEIDFLDAPMIIPLLEFTCPPVGKGGDFYTNTNAAARMAAAGMLNAYPRTVKFEATKAKGPILLSETGGRSNFKMTVEQLTDD